MKPFLILACLTALLGCQTGNQRVSQLYGGPDGMAALSTPDQVRAWRTISPLKLKRKPNLKTKGKLAEYFILLGPVPVNPQQSTAMATLLQNSETYALEPKLCKFNPGVAIEYAKGTEKVLIFYCFACDSMAVYQNGKLRTKIEFDPGSKALAEVIKHIFPDDAVIQKL